MRWAQRSLTPTVFVSPRQSQALYPPVATAAATPQCSSSQETERRGERRWPGYQLRADVSPGTGLCLLVTRNSLFLTSSSHGRSWKHQRPTSPVSLAARRNLVTSSGPKGRNSPWAALGNIFLWMRVWEDSTPGVRQVSLPWSDASPRHGVLGALKWRERSLGPWWHYPPATATPSCLHPDFLIMWAN